MRVLFLTNYPSPYRVNFFDELGKHADVTVLYFSRPAAHRDKAWFVEGAGRFRAVQLGSRKLTFRGRTVCLDVTDWLKQTWDAIVVCGYSFPTAMFAMTWLRLHRVPFYMEVDGGLIRHGESRAKYLLKRSLVRMADHWLSTGPQTTKFLVHYGAEQARVLEYPFSSLYQRDILPGVAPMEEKLSLRQELGITEKHMVLAIGQFIPRKGFDVLIRAAGTLDRDTGIYIVGGEATEEYRKLRQEAGAENVHFLGFQKKERLASFYRAADLFVLPTREDIWGLVINEALAYGLPTITTDRCVAGLELIRDGVNGYLVAVDDADALADRMQRVLSSDLTKMGEAALEAIRPYTLENMAKSHMDSFESVR